MAHVNVVKKITELEERLTFYTELKKTAALKDVETVQLLINCTEESLKIFREHAKTL